MHWKTFNPKHSCFRMVVMRRHGRRPHLSTYRSLTCAPKRASLPHAWALGLDGRPTSEEGAPDRESASPEPAATALLLHTSGTTAKPKLVTLTHANLLFSARQISETLKLQEDDCCLNIMPLFHIHGLIAALLSTLCSGGRIICTEGLRPADFPSWLQNFNPTWYTAVPTMHQAILKVLAGSRPRPACPGLRFVRSSSATLPARLRQDLEATLGVPVIEAYGMTEAGILIASTPLPPDASRVSSVGRTAGPEIAIIDAKGDFLPVGATGEVVIRGANVTPGYLHNPEANEKSFVNGWFRTGDQGYLDADGYLYLRGRLKEVVNRGAEKINPFEVDKQLLEHPAVAQAVAFAVPHPTLGEDLAAAVSLRPGETTDERNLREYLFERLAAHKVPSRIVIVESIPKGPTGKIQRIGLAESLADALTVRYGAPSSTWEWFLAEAFETVLKHSGVGRRDNFFHLGGDSLQAQQIINQINHSFGLELKAGVLFRYPSVADLAEVVDREAPAEKVEEEVATILEEIENLTEKEVERKLSESLE